MSTKAKAKAKTNTLTATQAYNEVASAAEQIANAEPATIEVVDPGDVIRQGDLYLVRLDARLPAAKEPWPSRQLAIGETQGSRHIAEGERCEVYRPIEAEAMKALHRLIPATRDHNQFLGPTLWSPLPITITHPEHGHRTIPAGAYQVTYQRVWANEIRRVAD